MTATPPREFRDVPIGLIDEPDNPSRTQMDEARLDELTVSIRRDGVIQPIALVRVGDRFRVIAGHRRRIAAARAGLVTMPAIVYPNEQAALDAVQYAENRFREELNAADEAIWFSELLERKCGGDVDALCELVHEKRGYVEHRLLLFQGDPEVFAKLQAGALAIGVAHQLNRCTDPQYRRYLLHQAIVGGATIAVVSGWIQDWQRQQAATNPDAAPAPAPALTSPIPETNYFTCLVCGKTDHVHLMRPRNIHQHCELAILDPLLASYRGEP